MSIFIFAIAGGITILYNTLVIRNFPESERKPGYIVTVVIFFLLALVLFGTFSARSMINSAIKTYSSKLERYIMDNHSGSDFVKDGLDLTGISEDIPRLNETIAELNSVLPSHTELGIPKPIYDSATNHIMKQLKSSLAAGGTANIFASANNRLTLLSILNGMQIVLMKIVDIIAALIVIIVAIMLAIYIIWSLLKVSKEKRKEITP